ncbi:excinuclease UvrABC subunit UvrC [Gammaproteobacteria bacterium]|nr:excinuclease UvrABC subunit UvrC [Gammaproteobacteria bacterium]
MMRDLDLKIIYVGKAKNLKNRLSSYFRSKQQSPKTTVLITHIHIIDITITPTETDALILENNLIKQHKPRYNVRLIDDKSYPYIHLSKHLYPKLSSYRGGRKLAGTLFGPYPSSQAVRDTLEMMMQIFKVRQCEDAFFSNRSRPCLQFQIKRCSAPCTSEISQADYAEDVLRASEFLHGKSSAVLDDLILKMAQASTSLAFENAAKYRDQITQIRKIQSNNAIEGNINSLDIFALHLEASIACIALLSFRDGRLLGAKNYFPVIYPTELKENILNAFISQFYGEQRLPPAQIVLDHNIDDLDFLSTYLSNLSGRKVTILFQVKAQKNRFRNMAKENALQAIKVKLAGKASISARLSDLQKVLRCANPIKRIECFDISHTFGERTVASNVVFTQEGLSKTNYRRFNIEGITGGDDYAAMRQALTRRFRKFALDTNNIDFQHIDNADTKSRDLGDMPDMVLIDGGRNQLQIGIDVLQNLKIENIALIGVAKGEGRKSGLETLWIAGQETPLLIANDSPAFHLILQIRDEAHRFAIEGHRARRDKARRRSILEDIPGIGEKRRQALLTNFGGLGGLKQASIEDIAKISGISDVIATLIFQSLKGIETFIE